MQTVRNLLDNKELALPVFVSPDAPVYEALEKMVTQNIGSVLVMDGDRLVGIFTERDYAFKGEVAGRSAKAPVKDVMTPKEKIIWVTPMAHLGDCAELMDHHNIRHIVVMTGDKVEGVISQRDLIRALNQDLGRLHLDHFGYGRT